MNQKITFLAGVFGLLLFVSSASWAQEHKEREPWVAVTYNNSFSERHIIGCAGGACVGVVLGTVGNRSLLVKTIPKIISCLERKNIPFTGRVEKIGGFAIRSTFCVGFLGCYLGGAYLGTKAADIQSVSVRLPKLMQSSSDNNNQTVTLYSNKKDNWS